MRTILPVILVISALVASSAICCAPCADGGDWPQTYGGSDRPYHSDAPSPALGGDGSLEVRMLWQAAGEIEDGIWKVPSTAVCVGGYTYYAKCEGKKPSIIGGDGSTWHSDNYVYSLNKAVTATGEVVSKWEYEARSLYNTHLAVGGGKVFVPEYHGKYITIFVYGADDLRPVEKYPGYAQGTYVNHFRDYMTGVNPDQGYLCYVERDGRGYLMTGTYAGPMCCFDTDSGSLLWRNGACGYYNQSPVVVGRYVLYADKGFGLNEARTNDAGSSIHVCDLEAGEVASHRIAGSNWHTLGPLAYENGRVYAVVQDESYDHSIKMTQLKIHSFRLNTDAIGAGGDVFSDEKVWTYPIADERLVGSQAGLSIVNGRLYLGGGGATMGSDTIIYVIDVGGDGGMSTAYSIPVKTKGTPTVSVQDGVAYLYFTPYDCHAGARLYVARDVPGQTEAVYGYFDLNISGDSVYSYQPVSIAPGGELLVRLDTDLLCLGGLASYGGSEYATGDLDGDGVHGYLDLALMARVDRGLAPREAYYDAAGDCNWDGRFDGEDLAIAMEKSAGTRSNLCPVL